MGIAGWKTITGAGITLIGKLLVAFNVIPPDAGDAIEGMGNALLTVGIGHKLDKAAVFKK